MGTCCLNIRYRYHRRSTFCNPNRNSHQIAVKMWLLSSHTSLDSNLSLEVPFIITLQLRYQLSYVNFMNTGPCYRLVQIFIDSGQGIQSWEQKLSNIVKSVLHLNCTSALHASSIIIDDIELHMAISLGMSSKPLLNLRSVSARNLILAFLANGLHYVNSSIYADSS